MPTINHGERTYVLKTIRLKCLKCNTICETSNPYPDTAMCQCGKVRVDGGISAGANVYGNPWAYEDYSIYRAQNRPKTELSQIVVTQNHEKVKQEMIENYKRHGIPLDEIMSGR